MADDLHAIVQRMLDAGESEDNIATVIRAQQPFDINASRAALAAENAKPLPAAPALADEFTASKMGERALAGAKGEAKGFAGGLAAPVLALGYALRHPVDAADKAGKAALMLGAAGVNAVAHPVDTLNTVTDAATRIGMDPESIGEVAGGVGAAAATPALVRLAKGTALGNAVAAGASDAANRIPGVQAAREALAAAKAAKNPSPVVTLADAAASRPAAVVAKREAYAPLAGQTEADAVRSLVVPNADAAASAPGARMADLSREPYRVPTVEGVGRQAPAKATGEVLRDQRMLAKAMKYRDSQLADRIGQQAAAEEAAQTPALDALPNKRNVSNMQVVEGSVPNASGESAASAEALSRLSSMKAKGESFAVLKGGKLRTLIGPEAVDYVPQPGEQFGIVDKDMAFRTLSRGSTKLTPNEAALIGNRSKGALPLAERKALLDAMLKKGGQ